MKDNIVIYGDGKEKLSGFVELSDQGTMAVRIPEDQFKKIKKIEREAGHLSKG